MSESIIGEYIRFGYGEIGIVKYYDDINIGIITQYGETEISSSVDKIAKRLIDIVEVGDIINQSERILDITGDYILTTERNCSKSRFEKTIKTILTHEMYEQNCYKVGEENE